MSGFKQDTNVAVEMQIHSRNFKPKGGDGGDQGETKGYSFRLVGVYKLEGVQVPQSSSLLIAYRLTGPKQFWKPINAKWDDVYSRNRGGGMMTPPKGNSCLTGGGRAGGNR